MRTPTGSPTPSASRSRPCASGSASPGSSPPWPASATASTQDQTPSVRQETVDRVPGLSVRLKLTLSYAGFLVLAGALLLALWALLLRYFPQAPIVRDTRAGIGGGRPPGRLRGPKALRGAGGIPLAVLL